MFNWSRTMEILCDAPAYPIVVACKRIGLERPEDVRWLKMDHFLNGHQSWRERLRRQPFKALLGLAHCDDVACSCSAKLPLLEKCTFTFNTGQEVSYLIGQCHRCRTVYWDDCP